MAIESIFYLNAADLTLATAAYLDLALTNLAPDGFYKEGTITRQQSSGILLTAEPCVTCGTPCGTSIGGGGSSGIYTVNLDVGSISGSTGAIRIMFNPDNVPDGVRVTYNGVVYNKLSSPIVGVRQSSNSGHYTIVGTSGATSSCSSWYPSGGTLTLPVKLYNPATSSFVATGVNQTDVISVGDFFIGTRVENCWMVIPKTTTLPSSLLIEMIGPCTSTGWDFSAYCPAALPTFPASDVFAGATVPCSTPIPNTFYFAKVHLAADTYVGLYDYVFTDVNGQFPLPNGYYLTSNVATPNKVIQVGNGVIIGITDCTTPTVVTIPTLITTAITNITTTSATSGGESINANNGVISAKGIEWSATQNFASILGSTSNGTGTGNFSSNLTSLTPDNTYWVRSYATNEAGTGYGSPLSFLTSQTVVLAPFDYIIVTYQYSPPVGLDYDLDTLTTFRYPESTITGATSSAIAGFIPGTGVVGCGTSSQIPNSTVPTGRAIDNSYLTFGGDDASQSVDGSYGESVVINFKKLEDSGILDPTKNIIISELFAGWHRQEGGYTDYPIEIKYETYVGGVISNYYLPPVPPSTTPIATNRYISDGTRPDPTATSSPITAAQSGCSIGVTGLNAKRKMASISYNRTTKAASVTFS